jgi:uncharacterized protein (TIGR00661 family)
MAVRVLYGVCGDGLGHAMRAQVAAAHLVAQGHDVRFAASGRAAGVLRAHGFTVTDVRGIHAHYQGGSVERARTVLRVVAEAPERLRHNARVALEEAATFGPHVAITDFNGFACAVAAVCGCPAISLDHQHVLDRFHHPPGVVAPFAIDFALARAAVGVKTPGCARYIVTSFYFPGALPAARDKTRLTGPIVRAEVEALAPSVGDHVLVYQTATGDARLLDTMRSVPEVRFRVYGHGRASGERPAGNVELCDFDERTFLADLAGARAVVTNGGFTTISEALYLGKPVLSVPLEHQAEQLLNAAWLEELGLGIAAFRPRSATIRDFIALLPSLRQAAHRAGDARLRTGTRDTLAALDAALREVA